jgi:DNA-directed RNA polymerase specialized sigma subunit
MEQNARMTVAVMEDPSRLQSLARTAAALPTFDRLVLQLRWAEGLNRIEAAAVLDAEPASVLAAEMRLRDWAIRSTEVDQDQRDIAVVDHA